MGKRCRGGFTKSCRDGGDCRGFINALDLCFLALTHARKTTVAMFTPSYYRMR